MGKIMTACAVFLGVLFFAISSFALTPQQVIDLKKAGVSDQTIQMMLKQEETAKNNTDTIGVKEIKDKEGSTVIIYTTGGYAPDNEEKQNVERAWEMLRNMTIKQR